MMAEKGWVAEFGKKDHFTREPEPGVRLEIELLRAGYAARLFVGPACEKSYYRPQGGRDFKKAVSAAETLFRFWLGSDDRGD